MTKSLLSLLISMLLGSYVVVNGMTVNSEDIIASAHEAVNDTNVRQLSTVLELYYSNYSQYPDVSGGEELIELFEDEGLIRNRPLDPSVFEYYAVANGQDYVLKLSI